MHSLGLNGEEKSRGQLPNPGSPGKAAIDYVCMCVCDPFLPKFKNVIYFLRYHIYVKFPYTP